MTEVDCTVGGCGYTGTVESVEAHISGSTRDGHAGEVGRHHREALVEQAEAEAGGVLDVGESADGTEDDDPTGSPLGVAEAATSESDGPEVAGPVGFAGSVNPVAVLAVLSVVALLYFSYGATVGGGALDADGSEPEAGEQDPAGGMVA